MTILAMLDYGDVIYRSAGKSALERLDVLYHSAIRFATIAPYRAHHCTLYLCNLVISVYPSQDPLVDAYLYNPLRPHSPLSEISTAALIVHIQHPFCQSHIPGSLVFSVHCS